jgi:elongation factor G
MKSWAWYFIKSHEEDPTLMVEYSRELKQVILGSQGELHLSTTKWKLEKLYKLEVDFVKPRIPTARLFKNPPRLPTATKNKAAAQDNSAKCI